MPITIYVPSLLVHATVLFAIIFVMLLALNAILIVIDVVKNWIVDQYRKYAFKKMLNEAFFQ